MATPRSDRPTHIEVSTPAPGDGETITIEDARGATSGKRILAVLAISLGAAVIGLGAYWAINAPKLQTADASSGGVTGQLVTDSAAKTFNAPAPIANPPSTIATEPRGG